MSNAAYFIFDVTINNVEGMLPYQAKVGQSIEPFGGKCLVLAGDVKVFEGEKPKGFTVIVQFPSKENANNWYHSTDYQSIINYRHTSAKTNAYLIEGITAA